jgi:Integrase core domain
LTALANGSCESFMKTLKHEEIYANDYRDHDHLRANIEAFVERYYNCRRLHSALGYRPPQEFEQAQAPSSNNGPTMSFFRYEEIYRSDLGFQIDGKPASADFPDHRLDESPTGYSLAGWSPPEPASASPAVDQFEGNGIA